MIGGMGGGGKVSCIAIGGGIVTETGLLIERGGRGTGITFVDVCGFGEIVIISS